MLAALAANIGIGVAKFVGFVITRSGSMLAEAAHSLADCGNQGLLLFGRRRARKAPSPEHPFGHERERYFSGFLVAIVLFTGGAGFALREGIHKLRDPHEVESPMVAIVILLVGVVLESLSLRTAAKEADRERGGASWTSFIRSNKDADLTVILLEDSGALLGLFFALAGVGLAAATGNSAYDAAGTIAIAALLGAIAIVMGAEMKSLLIGEAAAPEEVEAIRGALLDGAPFGDVIHLRTEHRGPDELLVTAKVAVAPGMQAGELAPAIDAAERRIRDAVPHARYIFIEPDIRRS